ncbi:MAG: hypothetical protein ND895_16495 [Pyrinomonadaceae bacterium]|nr:hypothetical protein [Pyrinomonadaceae bacterium]
MNKDPLKLIVAGIAAAYFLWCAYDPYQWHLIDGVNLLIHEAGHIVFRPFGEFMMIAGGSLFQVIMPALFVGYFSYHKKFYSAALVLFWVGESILNVSVYAGDSLALRLDLIGGEDTLHDWNYMLGTLGLLPSTEKIGGAIRVLGTVVIILACVGAFRHAERKDRGEGIEM